MAANSNNDYLKERIKFLTEILKLVFALFLVVASGTVALIIKQFKQPVGREALLVGIGMVLTIILGVVFYSLFSSIDKNIRKLF